MSELISDFIRGNDTIIATIMTFSGIFIAILLVSRNLLYQLVFAFDPEAKSQHNRIRTRPVRVTLAIADILAWLFAIPLTCQIFRFSQVTEFLLSVIGTIIPLLAWTLAVLLLAFCFSRIGNELMLSVIGFWYLQRHQADLDRCRYFDLGDQQMAEIETIDLLATKFRLKESGQIIFRPNAYLMHQFFGFTPSLGIEDVMEWLRSRSPKR